MAQHLDSNPEVRAELSKYTSNKLELFMRSTPFQAHGSAPIDYRFEHSQNHMKHCWVLYNEMLNCMKRKLFFIYHLHPVLHIRTVIDI